MASVLGPGRFIHSSLHMESAVVVHGKQSGWLADDRRALRIYLAYRLSVILLQLKLKLSPYVVLRFSGKTARVACRYAEASSLR